MSMNNVEIAKRITSIHESMPVYIQCGYNRFEITKDNIILHPEGYLLIMTPEDAHNPSIMVSNESSDNEVV